MTCLANVLLKLWRCVWFTETRAVTQRVTCHTGIQPNESCMVIYVMIQ